MKPNYSIRIRMPIRNHTRTLAACLALLCAALLAGCSDLFTTKNSAPYSATEVMRLISKKYDIAVELQTQEVIKGPPYASMRYVLKSKKDNFNFTADASVTSDMHFGWTSKSYSTTYTSALMYHCRSSAQAFAADYSLRYVPIASPTDYPEDKVYLSTPAQIEDAVSLYFDLLRRYNFPPKLDPYAAGDYFIYYLPPDETDLTKAVRIIDYHYGYDFIDTPEKLRSNLSSWWDEKYRNKQIPVSSRADDPNYTRQNARPRERLRTD